MTTKLNIKDIINRPSLSKPVLKTITTDVDGEEVQMDVYIKKVSFATAHDMSASYDIDFANAEDGEPTIKGVNIKQLQAVQIQGSICDENGLPVFESAEQVLALESQLASDLYKLANEVNNFVGKSATAD